MGICKGLPKRREWFSDSGPFGLSKLPFYERMSILSNRIEGSALENYPSLPDVDNSMKFSVFLVCLLIWPGVVFSQAQEYAIDAAKSVFSFDVEHFGVATVHGAFSSASGTIWYDPLKPDSMLAQISIDVKSIDTDNKVRDKELRSEDFLDTDRYPTVEFASNGISLATNTTQRRIVMGKMKVYGTTRDVELPFTVSLNLEKNELTIRSEFVIKRSDYKLKFGILMDSLVCEEIRISTVMVSQKK